MKLLDPKLDIVFKLLFAHKNNRDILILLLTAVLRPSAPIGAVKVLNPEVPKDLPADKGIVLDIHARLEDGRHIDVEMQSEVYTGLTKRFLYYWARLHASQLTLRHHYEKLCPAVSVIILRDPLLPIAKAHSKCRVLEVETGHELTSGECGAERATSTRAPSGMWALSLVTLTGKGLPAASRSRASGTIFAAPVSSVE